MNIHLMARDNCDVDTHIFDTEDKNSEYNAYNKHALICMMMNEIILLQVKNLIEKSSVSQFTTTIHQIYQP
jgi:hypothetical protein